MSSKEIDPKLFEKYLDLLNVQVKKPNLKLLTDLVSSHIIKIPFENISKIYYKLTKGVTRLLPFDIYLDGIANYNFGGTCYTNNYYFNLLLNRVGYDAKLCGADMSNPDVHIVNMVKIEDREYLVDVGYGAPFLNPIPRYLREDYVLRLGNEKYMFKPMDGRGFTKLEFYKNKKLKHGYTAKPFPKKKYEFDKIISDSIKEDSTFMNTVILARFFENSSTVIRNMKITKSNGLKSKTKLISNRDELVTLISENFSIPRYIVTEVISDLGELKDTWV